MGIKDGAKEIVEIAIRIADENNIDLDSKCEENQKDIDRVWSQSIKEFDSKY